MNIHEYQAKALLAKFAVPLLKGGVAYTKDEAMDVARKLGSPVAVVKAQIHAGGRGKGRFKNDPNGKGGVRIAKSIEEVGQHAAAMLGHDLVTKQTGATGKTVKRLYIEEGVDIKREIYLSMLVDRAVGRIAVVASTEGGMDIETVAKDHPEKIVEQAIDPAAGFQPYEGRKIAFALKLEGKQVGEFVKLLDNLYKAFTQLDCSLLEINPLIVSGAGQVIALDAKMNFDDNALYRHKELEDLRDVDEEDPAETEAAKFLDVGGGATKERVTAAFKIILKDPNVEGILVNIFGGIMRCDVIAEGVVAAAREVNLHVPLVVRLEGTNVELGKKILKESGLKITSAENLADAAQKVVKAVKEAA